MRYLIVIEASETGFSAYSPDLPGCVATGRTRQEVEKHMREAIEFHIEGLHDEGQDVPPGTCPHFSPAFYCGGGFGHVYCVALCRAPRHTVEYACGALRNLHCYTWREAPSTIPVCAASLRNLVRNAG
jgi:predicted RNase H-like HicB family nuclease